MVGHGWVAQIGVDEQHLRAVLGKYGSSIDGRGGFAFAGRRGGDDQKLALTGRLVDFQEFDVRANTTVFLGYRAIGFGDDDRTRAFQSLVLRYGAERGGMDDAPHVGGFLDLGAQ